MRALVARSRQSGVALISVLLVFSIAAVIASDVATRSYRDVRKTANLINSKQAEHYALSGEQFARQILYRDFELSKKRPIKADSLSDQWASGLDSFTIEGGEIRIEIEDLQGRFNLNNLINGNGVALASYVNQFRELQRVLGLKGKYSNALLDWIDSDEINASGKFEDEQFSSIGYLPFNAPMVDKSELQLLPDMLAEDYQILREHVVALPKNIGPKSFASTKYNLNTLDAKLLEALGARSTAPIIEQQQRGGYKSVNRWFGSKLVKDLNNERRQNQLAVESEFFEVRVIAHYQSRRSELRVQLYRDSDDGSITVLKRQWGAG